MLHHVCATRPALIFSLSSASVEERSTSRECSGRSLPGVLKSTVTIFVTASMAFDIGVRVKLVACTAPSASQRLGTQRNALSENAMASRSEIRARSRMA
eukprot:2805800-Rhodomonas_salina.1